MTAEGWMAYVAASAALLIAPGPTNAVIAACGVTLGRRAVWPLAIGVALGDATAILLVIVGGATAVGRLGLPQAAVTQAGAIVLLVMGLHLLLARVAVPLGGAPWMRGGTGALLWQAWAVTSLNPVSYAMFVGLILPMTADGGSMRTVGVLAVFAALSLATSLAWGFGGQSLRRWVRTPYAAACCQRGSGALLVGLAATVGLAGA